MIPLLSRLSFYVLLVIPLLGYCKDDLESWETAYRELLDSNQDRALTMLQGRYNSTPPSVEKLYISSLIYEYMLLRDEPYHGNDIAYNDRYSHLEQTFIAALNNEDKLEFESAKQKYVFLLRHFTDANQLQGIVLSDYHLCRSLNKQGQYHSASLYCSSLLTHLTSREKMVLPRYKALRVIANNHAHIGDYKVALDKYQQYLAAIPSHVDPSGVYNDAALLLKTLGNLSLAKEYAKVALELRLNRHNELHIAQTHHTMGDILLADNQVDEAIIHFNKAKDILNKHQNDYGLTYALLGLGKAHIAKKEFTIGKTYLLSALENATLQLNSEIQGDIYLTLAAAHRERGQYITAEDFANHALSLSTTINSAEGKSNALKTLALLAQEQTRFQQALDYYQQYISTELNKRDKHHQAAYIALNVAHKEYIQQLQHSEVARKNQQLKQQVDQQQTQLSILVWGCILLFASLCYSLYNKRRATRRAEKDLLTQAWNRAATIREIKRLPSISQDGFKYLVILLDIDDFKRINDNYGHPTGDQALIRIANALKDQCSRGDIFGRLGGEEFVIVMRNIDELDIENKVIQLHQTVEKTTFLSQSKKKLNLTASFSYLATNHSLTDFDELYSILDQALYQVKHTGKNRTIDAFNEPIYRQNSV